MSANEIHMGDIMQFEITVKDQNNQIVDLSSATTKEFLFQKPDGSLLVQAASFLTDGTDGVLVYRTTTGDLNQSGTWRYQVHVIYTSNEQHSDVTKFKVFANLPIT